MPYLDASSGFKTACTESIVDPSLTAAKAIRFCFRTDFTQPSTDKESPSAPCCRMLAILRSLCWTGQRDKARLLKRLRADRLHFPVCHALIACCT